ncbi:class I SAM-dependent methyltransferase [Marinilongibacter aquaticus]|uniref:class I SAM-dependent methyltransferase n=1 Tax=Marinilongibacter aquaticus TaxID=2975157 RepID=UPI0021BD02AA|nr:class I SAM-dependent methyltransferase [Marinilongibacter aquaticus]UBM59166.1 class I SAM-dependent methyltransferase [Marinilongibacter aquaticus]
MNYSTTEITSAEIASDNPIHQRLYFPYEQVAKGLKGHVLELGCGWGRGVEKLISVSDHFTGLDKNADLIGKLQQVHPQHTFRTADFPHLEALPNESFDFIVTFQVIEHIEDDRKFLSEAHRLLKKGGQLILTTVNKNFSLSRNPWHVREYEAKELQDLMSSLFENVETLGVNGNEKVWEYYEENKKSVNKLMKWDILDLQHRLPAWMLRTPYEFMNRLNRDKLLENQSAVAKSIVWEDYFLSTAPEECLDFYYIATK